VRRLTRFARFICQRENLVRNSLICLEAVDRLKNINNFMKFKSPFKSVRRLTDVG